VNGKTFFFQKKKQLKRWRKLKKDEKLTLTKNCGGEEKKLWKCAGTTK
jgi:hypothetical protein